MTEKEAENKVKCKGLENKGNKSLRIVSFGNNDMF